MNEKRAKKVHRREARRQAKAQKERARLSKRRRHRMYIDESGNSGNNIFDENQTSFFSFGVISRADLAVIEKCRQLRDMLQVKELHGNELGLGKISDISSDLLDLVRENDLHFICSEINKIYFGKMKFFDVIFDSGTNPGVDAIHCFSKPLKYVLMIGFADLVTPGELKQFWAAYGKRNISLFRGLMEDMARRVSLYSADKRAKELLYDCYLGAAAKPDQVLGSGLIDWDSPNVTSVIMFIHELHKVFDGSGVRVDEVVHDSQQQFGLSIEDAYRVLHHVRVIWNIADFTHKQVKVFSPNFYTCESGLCDGLQLADIFLYLHKKSLSVDLKGGAKTLYSMINSRMRCLYMTRDGLWAEAYAMIFDLYSRRLKPTDLVRGVELMEEIESKRKTRLLEASSDDEGASIRETPEYGP
jgi:hypothetical protein